MASRSDDNLPRMTEAQSRKRAAELNALREPGDPIWTGYPLDIEHKTWTFGPVALRDLKPTMPPRTFEDI